MYSRLSIFFPFVTASTLFDRSLLIENSLANDSLETLYFFFIGKRPFFFCYNLCCLCL